MKKFLSLFMAVMAVVGLSAQTVKSLTWTSADEWTLDTEAKTATLTEDGFQVVAVLGANTTNNAPTVNATGKDFRAYVGNDVTIAAPEGTQFTKVVFVVSTQGKKRWSAETAVNVGALTNDVEAGTVTWEGEATNAITITVGAKSTLGTDGAAKAAQFDVDSPIELTLVDAPSLLDCIQNADFSSLEGWTVNKSEQFTNVEVGKIGELTVNNVASVADDAHTADMFCLGLSARWAPNRAAVEQTTSALAAGEYILSFDVANPGDSKSYDMGNLTYVQVGETKFYDEGMTAAKLVGATGWVKHSITFTVAEEGPVTISFGYQNNANEGSGTTPELFISNLQLGDAAASIKALLADEIATAEALLAGYDASADYAVALAEAIATAKAAKIASTAEGQAAIDALKAAEATAKEGKAAADLAAFKATFAQLEAGDYVLQNASTGLFFGGANSWGTQGTLLPNSTVITLAKLDNGYYTLDTHCWGDGKNNAKHFLGSNLYVDNLATEWAIVTVADGVYALTADNGATYAAAPAEGNIVVTVNEVSEAAQWKLVSTAELLENLQPGTDVTFLIKNAAISRGLYSKEANWIVSDNCTNKNLGGGANENNCAESYHSPFDIYQVIENVPNGTYALTAQAFYRQDGSDEENLPVLYANEKTQVFPVKTGDENSMAAASNSFTSGLYKMEPVTVEVTDGTLRVGVKCDNNALWCIWDNFELTYVAEAAAVVAELEVGTEYNEDHSQCTLVVTPTKEGTMLYWTDEENGEPMGLINGEDAQPVVVYTPGRGEEAGTQVWQIYVYEVDEEFNVVAMGYEQVNLVAPKPVLEIATAYNEDNSSCVVTATATQEGTSFVISIDGGEEFMELPEEGYTVAWLEAKADEQGICIYNIVIKEVIWDEEFNMTEVSTAEEQIHLSKPLPVLEIATAYNEDNSSCVVTAEPTEEGTQMVISIDGGTEFLELPAEGYTVAWTPGMANEQGVCVFNVVVREVKVTYDEELEMDVMETIIEGSEQVLLTQPIDIPAMAGDSEENPVELVESWTMIPAAEVGKDEANKTYFSYTAEHAGLFVFSCNPGKIADCTLPELSEEQYMGMGTGYGKVVAKGETVTFSAILPAVFEGVAYDENGEEIVGETELYDVDTYYITAEVQALPVVVPEKPEAPKFSELVADNETVYYLYNVDKGAFMLGANDWNTRASLSNEKGFKFHVRDNNDGKYSLIDLCETRDNQWLCVFVEKANSMWVDNNNGANANNWTIKALDGNTYQIGNTGVEGLLGTGNDLSADSRLYMVEEGNATTWAFISEADYAAYWEAAADYVAYQKIEAAKEKIFAMASELNSTNVYTAEAMEAFQAKYPVNAWVDGAEYNTLTAADAEAAEAAYKANFAVTGWHAANDIDDLLTSAWEGADGNFGGKYYINTWSTEGETDGSGFKVPFFEYWTGDANKLGDNTMTAKMTGLIPGATYTASALARVRMTNGVEDAAEGISFKVGDGEATAFAGDQIGTSQFYMTTVMATGKANADGELTISFVVDGANVSWLSWKNVYYWMESLPTIEAEVAYNESQTAATITTDYVPAEGNMLVAYVNYDFSEPYAMFEDGKVEVAPVDADFNHGAAHLIVTIREVKYDEATEEFVAVAEGQVELDFTREVPVLAGDSQENPIELATGWSDAIAKDDCGTDESGYTHFKYTAEIDGTFVFSCGFPTTFGDEDGMAEIESTEVRCAYGKAVKAGEVVEFSAYLPGAWWNEDTEEMVMIDELMFYANVTPVEGEVPLYEILDLAVEECEGWEPGFVQEEKVSVVSYAENSFTIRGVDGVEGNDATIVFDEDENVVSINGVTEGYVTVGKYQFYVAPEYAYAYGDAEEGYALLTAYVGEDYGYYYIAWGGSEIEDCDLTADMFCEWDGVGADATVVHTNAGACEWGASTDLPYGHGSVLGSCYADLTPWSALALTVTEGTPRLLLNRESMDGSGKNDFIEINNSDSPYVLAVIDGVWYINLTKITEEAGYAHLNCIKGANWANVTITEAKLLAEVPEAVGINGVAAATSNDVIYDLAGRRVSKVQKGGMYIVNGKKVAIK